MLSATAVVALAGFGFEIPRRAIRDDARLGRGDHIAVAIVALVDVFLMTHWLPSVVQPAFVPDLRRALIEVQDRDSTPFVVGLGNGFDPYASTIALENADRGLSVGNSLTPFVPRSELEHCLLAYPAPNALFADKVVTYDEGVHFRPLEARHRFLGATHDWLVIVE